MENIDPSLGLNRQFFQHFTGQHSHYNSSHHQQQQHQHNSYQHSHHHHPFHPHHPGLEANSHPHADLSQAAPPLATYSSFPPSCSFSPPVNFASPAASDHLMTGSHAYPPSNPSALYTRTDSYSESSSPNLNSSSGSVTGFQPLEHVAPYTPSPSESDSLDQNDSIDSCDPSSMTAVDLEDEEDGDRVQRVHRHHRRRRPSSTRSGSPVLQRQAANLRERRRMQSINEAFEVRTSRGLVACLFSFSTPNNTIIKNA